MSPQEEQRIIHVKIPKYDFNEEFSYRLPYNINIEELSWDEALQDIIASDPFGIRAKRRIEELDEIYTEHKEEIQEEWKEYRKQEINDEIEQLEDELETLQ